MLKNKLLPIIAITSITLGSQVMAWEENVVTIWIKSDKGHNGLQALGDLYTERTGIKVVVETPEDTAGKYESEAIQGQGPDIMIWTHDRIGDWAQSGLISPVEPGKEVIDSLDDSFWGATTYDGQVFGYPISVEGPTQICNADIVKKPFTSIDEVKAAASDLAVQGKKALMWDYNNTYFTYGFLSAEGGFAFENIDGAYNSQVTGINNEGAIAGAQMVKDLIDQGVMPGAVDYSVFDTAFKAGEVACVINGPWAWADYEEAGIDIILGPYPKLEQGTPKVLTGVLSASVNSTSPNQVSAVNFIENYLLTEKGLLLVDDDRNLGVVTHEKTMNTLSENNTKLKDAFDVWVVGEPIPNIPEMALFWSSMQPALSAIAQGRETAVEALNAAALNISQ